MHKTIFSIGLAIFLLTLSLTPAALAHGNSGRGGDDNGRLEVRIRQEIEDENEIEIGGQRFEISGEVQSLSGNSLVVSGQTIVIDPSKVREFEQKGLFKVGSFIKAEGQIIDGTKFAREIKVLGEGQGRFKFEVKGLSLSASPTPTPSPTASPTVTPTPAASPSPEGTPSASPSPTLSGDARVEIKARGPLSQVTDFLRQILSFLNIS